MAKERGYKVGIVTSVSIDHATPACFYAHQPSRYNYYEIIQEMLLTTTSERQGRLIDSDSAGSMEKKKIEGYF